MNAVEFVKNQISEFGLDAGWEKAKAHIDYLISYGSEFGHVSKEEVEELEQLVKSWELVESVGGWNSATVLYDEYLDKELGEAIRNVEKCQ